MNQERHVRPLTMNRIWKSRRISPQLPLSRLLFYTARLLVLELVFHPAVVHADGGNPSDAPAQQVIHLEEGWNNVALNVVPADLNLSVVFASVLNDIELVKNSAGAIFSPEYGIDMLSPIDPSKGYKVKARRATDVTITGTPIDFESSPVSLSTGWNLVPFYPNEKLSVVDAFAEILAHIVRIEDGAGRLYSPDQSIDDLDSLMIGQSYNVFVDQSVTFSYPSDLPPPPQPSNDGLEVNTIFDAVGLAGLEVGNTITVLGYHTPGDGGGGIFRVEESACATDGGTCFGFAEHLSTEQSERYGRFHLRTSLGHTNIAFGTLSIDLIDGGGQTFASIKDEHLHGHMSSDRFAKLSMIDYKKGEVNHAIPIYNFMNDTGGEYLFKYRYYESSLRLVRQNIGSVLDVEWFGARTFNVDPQFDNQPIINRAINVARSLGTITTIRFQKPAVYEYFGSIELPEGFVLQGAGGTELVTAVDDLGNTYRPVRIKSNHTRLRVKDGEALKHLRMIYLDSGHPNYLTPDKKLILDTRRSVIRPVSGVMSAGLEDIVLDGNWENNQDAFQRSDEFGGNSALETELRNSPGWAGFVANNHGEQNIPLGQQLTIRNVAVIGYGSNGLLGNANNVWLGENVLLGNSVWNHVWYAAGGTWKNLTFTGFAWTHGTPSWGHIENLVYENGSIGPYRPAETLMSLRVPDIYDASETPPSQRYIRSDGTTIPLGISIDGFYIDTRGTGIKYPIAGIGANVELTNGVLIESGTVIGYLYTELGNGYQKALYPNNLIENIKVYQVGPAKGHLIGRMNVTESTVRNIEVIDLNDSVPTGRLAILSEANRRNHQSWENPQTIYFEDIQYHSSHEYLIRTAVADDAAGRDIYIRNSRFNNRGNKVVVGSNWSGELDSFTGDHNKLRVFFDNVELNLGWDKYQSQLELLFAVGYFRNVTATNLDRFSEDSGTFEYSANGGENYLDIPTNLFWVPEFIDVSESTGSSGLISQIEVTYPSSSYGPNRSKPSLRVHFTRSLNSQESVSLLWSAAVRPFPNN